ncbi:MAG TPA: hypothetical protein VNU68_00700 [Verrucomicrobiae bacterium]|nr:hypothetical protein [Verrucomicrobiae bacterium]
MSPKTNVNRILSAHALKPALAAATLALLISAWSGQAAQPNPNPGVIPVNASPYGKTYGEWSAAWWQWAFSLPATAHPILDTADCSAGQSGPVWFLAGKACPTPAPPEGCNANVAERTCTVPHGKALFFPIVNSEDSVIEESSGYGCLQGTTEAALRNCARLVVDGLADLACEIDGHSVQNLDSFRVQSPLFEFTLAAHDNLAAAVGETAVPDGATSLGVGDGIYVMLAPLSAGRHTLHFHARQTCSFCGNFTMDITYHLSVE